MDKMEEYFRTWILDSYEKLTEAYGRGVRERNREAFQQMGRIIGGHAVFGTPDGLRIVRALRSAPRGSSKSCKTVPRKTMSAQKSQGTRASARPAMATLAGGKYLNRSVDVDAAGDGVGGIGRGEGGIEDRTRIAPHRSHPRPAR